MPRSTRYVEDTETGRPSLLETTAKRCRSGGHAGCEFVRSIVRKEPGPRLVACNREQIHGPECHGEDFSADDGCQAGPTPSAAIACGVLLARFITKMPPRSAPDCAYPDQARYRPSADQAG